MHPQTSGIATVTNWDRYVYKRSGVNILYSRLYTWLTLANCIPSEIYGETVKTIHVLESITVFFLL